MEFINLVQILLKAADKWLPLGIHLHIPEDKLRKIGRDHCNLSDDCLFNMLQWWYHNSRPSWKLVMSALCEIDRRDIAKEISVKYGMFMTFFCIHLIIFVDLYHNICYTISIYYSCDWKLVTLFIF